MDRSLLYRILLYLGVTAVALIILTPSAASWVGKDDQIPGWFKKAFPRKILLGLDLQGGLHIEYRVDVDKAVGHKADRVATELEDRITEEAKLPSASFVVTRSGDDQIDVTFKNREDLKKLNTKVMRVLRRDLVEDSRDKSTGKVVLKIHPDQIDEMREYAVRQGVETIRNRVDKLGVADPTIIRKGSDIVVELPGLKPEDFERVKRLIGKTAQLEFKIVDDGAEYMTQKILGLAQAFKAKDPEKYGAIEVQHDSWTQKDNGASHADVFLRSKDRKALELFFADLDPQDQVPGDHIIGYEQSGSRDVNGLETQDVYWRTYYLHRRAELTGEYISDSDWGTDTQTMRPEVNLTFDRKGADIFEQLSGGNVGRKMAIILDDRINSAPVLESKIGGGRARITLGGGQSAEAMRQEAKDLVAVLRTGALPAPLEWKSETQVGPTLGRDSVQKAQLAMAVGTTLVIIFMLLYYRAAGAIADIAMLLNIIFLLAILASLEATLTLPGIAGVVLTVGMAVDANIIIYERIREELRAGKSPRGAVEAGFGRAFWTIFDAQVTTLVAGIVLYSYGSGPIRGFAVTLMAGIVCNLVTAIWITRAMFDFLLVRRKGAALSI